MRVREIWRTVVGIGLLLPLPWATPPLALADDAPRRLRQLGVNVSQEQIESGALTLREIRRQGLLVFSTPFGKADGYGDGEPDPRDPTSPGGRPTLQDNGTFLRVNGLDGLSCLECHSIVSSRVVPALFGVGGSGGAVTNVLFMPTRIDVADEDGRRFAGFDGRFINPPFLFGSGGVQLLANEMTADLQSQRRLAREAPGEWVPLRTKGIDFGWIRFIDGEPDVSRLEGIDADLVVRPFGRKGEFATVRGLDLEALQFHFGMQPVEVFGQGEDADGDGVVDEIGIGEVSALEIFNTTLEPPRSEPGGEHASRGAELFVEIGCADCHRPSLVTRSPVLRYRLPELPTDPDANVYYQVDLEPVGFRRARGGGIVVPLFADLKRHEMGPKLAEGFGSALDSQFTTPRHPAAELGRPTD